MKFDFSKMSGYLGDLSPNQEQALKELRETFKDELLPQHDDHLLLQFLRAKKFDLKKTQEMFRRHLEFRKKYPEEYYAKEYQLPKNIAILRDLLLPPVLGYDKDGCPVRLAQIGRQDIKGGLCCFRPSELPKYIVWFLDMDKEELRKRSRETGVHIEKRTFIVDLEGLNLMHIYRRDVYEMALSSLKLYENNYPENFKVAFIINTPSFFHYLFNMIKPLLSESTCSRLKIFGNSDWKEAILEHIDADLLPVTYGGTRTDPDGDPSCPSLVRVLNPIPKELYLKNMNTLSEDDENVRKISIAPRSKCSIDLRVEVSGSTVGWQVECPTYDVRMYLVYSEGSRHEVVTKPVTVSCDFGSETGCYLAERTGLYSLVLDNSYSIFRAKQILCKVYVTAHTSKMAHDFKKVLSENNNS